MPCASWIGFEPPAVCEPKISIMPTTVPKRPSSGDIAAIVPSVVRKRSRSCVTTRPTSSIASFITGRGLFTLARPAARMRPSGPCCAVRVRSSGVAPFCRILGEHAIDQARRRDDALPQRPQPLEDQRERDDRREDQRPDRPARCLNDGPHGGMLRCEKAARNVAWRHAIRQANVGSRRAISARRRALASATFARAAATRTRFVACRARRRARDGSSASSVSVAVIAAPASTISQHT